jgi:hypothetical protein
MNNVSSGMAWILLGATVIGISFFGAKGQNPAAQNKVVSVSSQATNSGEQLQFPNVKIETATQTQIVSAAKETQSPTGFRAYLDDMGHLRPQSPEEMIAEGSLPLTAQARTAAAAQMNEPVAIMSSTNGGFVAVLDERFMSNAVATKTEKGVNFSCVGVAENHLGETTAAPLNEWELRHER